MSTAGPIWPKIMWVIEELARERPRALLDIRRTTGWSYDDIDDAVCELIRLGRVRMRTDSRLEAVNKED